MISSAFNNRYFSVAFASFFLLWSAVHFFISYFYGISAPEAFLDSAVSNALLILACMRLMVQLKFYSLRKSSIFSAMGIVLVMSGLWSLVLTFLFKALASLHLYNYALFQSTNMIRYAEGFLILSLTAVIVLAWNQIRIAQQEEEHAKESERLAREAELLRLQQKLQPHFLFNSLNSISALITSRPEEAKQMIQQLSEFLRGTIKKEDQWANLEDELRHLQLYLNIEKVRFGHRLNAEVIITEECRTMKLPALLIQPLAENAIKFGLYDTTGEVLIQIKAICENNMLIISLENPFDPETSAPQKGTGFGLSSVQRRLYLLFGRNDLLKTLSTGNTFITTVKIPQP